MTINTEKYKIKRILSRDSNWLKSKNPRFEENVAVAISISFGSWETLIVKSESVSQSNEDSETLTFGENCPKTLEFRNINEVKNSIFLNIFIYFISSN